MLPDDGLRELRTIAKTATQGEWRTGRGPLVSIDYPTIEEYEASLAVFAIGSSMYGLIPHGILHENDARFVATFNPPMCLHLIDMITELKADLREQREIVEKQAGELMELSGENFALRNTRSGKGLSDHGEI